MVVSSLLCAGVAIAASSWQKDDPSQWTTEDVYQVLNNSPWSKSVRVSVARSSEYGGKGLGNGGNGGVWGEGMPGGGMGGGTGRRGNRGGYPPAEQAAAVTVQWESALPVRLAEAKSSGGAVDAAALKPLNEYVIAVIGLPKSGFGSRQATDSSESESDESFADHLKVITVLSFGNERLNPAKVELNQGRDQRTIFHFEKPDGGMPQEKNAEFRITSDRMEIKQKFPLKDMQFQGKLEL